MVTGEDESSGGAEEAKERCRFIAAEGRHCGFSESETMSFRSERKTVREFALSSERVFDLSRLYLISVERSGRELATKHLKSQNGLP